MGVFKKGDVWYFDHYHEGITPNQLEIVDCTASSQAVVPWFGPVTLRLGPVTLRGISVTLRPLSVTLTPRPACTLHLAEQYLAVLRFASNSFPQYSQLLIIALQYHICPHIAIRSPHKPRHAIICHIPRNLPGINAFYPKTGI